MPKKDRRKAKKKERKTFFPYNLKASVHTAQHSGLRHIRHVDEDIVRRVTV